jgi:hypothetical protein
MPLPRSFSAIVGRYWISKAKTYHLKMISHVLKYTKHHTKPLNTTRRSYESDPESCTITRWLEQHLE